MLEENQRKVNHIPRVYNTLIKPILPSPAYARGVTELVLCLILPQRDFKSPLFRTLAEDLISEQVFLPTVHYITTPHFLNSTIAYLVSE